MGQEVVKWQVGHCVLGHNLQQVPDEVIKIVKTVSKPNSGRYFLVKTDQYLYSKCKFLRFKIKIKQSL